MDNKEPNEDIKDTDLLKDELDGNFEIKFDEVKNIYNFDSNTLMKQNEIYSVKERRKFMVSKTDTKEKTNNESEVLKNKLEMSRELVCPNCPNKFATMLERNQHKASTHSELKPFVCDLCGKAFRLKVQMKVHGKVHNSEVNQVRVY